MKASFFLILTLQLFVGSVWAQKYEPKSASWVFFKNINKIIVLEDRMQNFLELSVDYQGYLTGFDVTEQVEGRSFSGAISFNTSSFHIQYSNSYSCESYNFFYQRGFANFEELEDILTNKDTKAVFVLNFPRKNHLYWPQLDCNFRYYKSLSAYKRSLNIDRFMCRGELGKDNSVKCLL